MQLVASCSQLSTAPDHAPGCERYRTRKRSTPAGSRRSRLAVSCSRDPCSSLPPRDLRYRISPRRIASSSAWNTFAQGRLAALRSLPTARGEGRAIPPRTSSIRLRSRVTTSVPESQHSPPAASGRLATNDSACPQTRDSLDGVTQWLSVEEQDQVANRLHFAKIRVRLNSVQRSTGTFRDFRNESQIEIILVKDQRLGQGVRSP